MNEYPFGPSPPSSPRATSSRRRSIGYEMFRSRMIGTRSKPMLVWLCTMSAAAVSDGITRYV